MTVAPSRRFARSSSDRWVVDMAPQRTLVAGRNRRRSDGARRRPAVRRRGARSVSRGGGPTQFEVEDRSGQGREGSGEHPDQHPDDDARTGAGRIGAGLEDQRDDRDEDAEDEDHAEHLPAVAANQLPTAPERPQTGGALEHDDRGEHGPDREQYEPRDDDQDEADHDPDARHEA